MNPSDGYNPGQFAGDLVTAAGPVLQWVGVAVVVALPLVFTLIAIRLGIRFVRGMLSESRDLREAQNYSGGYGATEDDVFAATRAYNERRSALD